MKLGKRERALRKERNRYAQQCRERHDAVMHPDMDEAACMGKVGSKLARFWPSEHAKPRVPAGWTATKARSLGQGRTIVIS